MAGRGVGRKVDSAAAGGGQIADGRAESGSLGGAGPQRVEPAAADHEHGRLAPLGNGDGLGKRLGRGPANRGGDRGVGRIRHSERSIDRRVERKDNVGHALSPSVVNPGGKPGYLGTL